MTYKYFFKYLSKEVIFQFKQILDNYTRALLDPYGNRYINIPISLYKVLFKILILYNYKYVSYLIVRWRNLGGLSA